VKRYSSGMYMRLAFAVAVHLEPDILIIDEVLAVGDVHFQRKCLNKIEDISRKEGRTVLFVSHNMESIKRLCETAFLLEHGKIAASGDVGPVIDRFLASNGACIVNHKGNWLPENPFYLHSIRLCNHYGEQTAKLNWEESFMVQIEYDVLSEAVNCIVWIALYDNLNQQVVCTADVDNNPELSKQRSLGRFWSSVKFPGALINVGSYRIEVGIQRLTPLENFYRVQDVTFSINHSNLESMEEFNVRGGSIKMILDWELHQA